MTKLFIFISILITGAVLSAKVKPVPVPIDWYGCSGKIPGRYMHPIDCTKFIICTPEEDAYEMRCPSCTNIRTHLCPHGRLVFNDAEKICFPSGLTRCTVGPESPPTPPKNSTTTESVPTVPVTSENPISSTSTSSEPPSSRPPVIPPKPGMECDSEDCTNFGYHCQSYLRCDKDTSKWVEEYCGENLFWNPLNPNGTEQVHGGNCDFLENIRPETLQKYREDSECSLE